MTIQTNTTDRKALVKAIATELHTEARYLRTPTYAYQIGDFTVDRDGNIIGEDFAPLHDFLLANGYIAEEQETATEVENTEAEPTEDTEDTTEDADAPVDVAETEPTEDTDEDATEDADVDAPVEATETEPAEDSAEDADVDAPIEDSVAEPAEDTAEDADADVPIEVTEMEPTEDNIEGEAEDASADVEAPVEVADAESSEATDEEPADEADAHADSEEEQQPADVTADVADTTTADTRSETAAPTDDSDPDAQTITIPAPDITAAQLRNLTFILYSRQYLLGLMTGGDTIQIPDALVQSLKNTLPDTPERFSDFLEIYRQVGLRGFDFKDGQFSMTFPFCENEPAKWTTFAELQGRILQAAMSAKRVAPDFIQPEEEAEKYTAHIWLQRLGYRGPEMKEQRNILLHHLHGYCAFSNGEKMQNHKDKYGAIRRERREAERAAVQAIVETIVPASAAPETAAPTSIKPETTAPASTEPEATEPTTTEASPSVVVLAKEVVTNE